MLIVLFTSSDVYKMLVWEPLLLELVEAWPLLEVGLSSMVDLALHQHFTRYAGLVPL